MSFHFRQPPLQQRRKPQQTTAWETLVMTGRQILNIQTRSKNSIAISTTCIVELQEFFVVDLIPKY